MESNDTFVAGSFQGRPEVTTLGDRLERAVSATALGYPDFSASALDLAIRP